MSYRIVNFYRFVRIEDLEALQQQLHEAAFRFGLVGTILMAEEGINAGLSGSVWGLESFLDELRQDERFQGITVRWSEGRVKPFSRLYVKIKPSIIKFSEDECSSPDPDLAEIHGAERTSPAELHRILRERPRETVLVDTRNWYETDYGTFSGAEILPIRRFTEFKRTFLERYGDQRDRQFVFFCTGGIRCEKIVPWAKKEGFSNVSQLDGGILNYLEQFGDEGFDGKCFVFDHRWIVDGELKEAHEDDYNVRIQPKPLSQES